MKIITLVPVKNEGWILRFSLKNFSVFSDEIIILDDNSIDNLKEIAAEYPKVRIIPFKAIESHVDMSIRRSILLSEGRKSGGTHFVFLDADEIFSNNFLKNIKNNISSMRRGETLLLPWVFVVLDNGDLCFNSKDKSGHKDFIFCDDEISIYKKQALSEERTPGLHAGRKYLYYADGYVIHFQKLAQKRNQLKQAWYRCNELLEGNRSASRINATYRHSKESAILNKEILNDHFTASNFDKIVQDADYDFYIRQITSIFDKNNIAFFEALDIWHIPELQKLFVKTTGRAPKPTIFPRWLLFLNDLKNKLKNAMLQ